MKTKTTFSSAEALIIIHSPDVKIRAIDWDESEYITYDPEKLVIDENGLSVNAAIFIHNDEWEKVGV